MSFRGRPRPRRLVHPGASGTVDVHSLRAAVAAALTPANLAAWVRRLTDGYQAPAFLPGDEVALDDVARLVEFVAEHLDAAGEEAATIAITSAELGLTEFQPATTVAAHLADFVRATQEWLGHARRHGGPAMVTPGAATIVDPSLLPGIETRSS